MSYRGRWVLHTHRRIPPQRYWVQTSDTPIFCSRWLTPPETVKRLLSATKKREKPPHHWDEQGTTWH